MALNLNLQTFTSWLENQAAAVQTSCSSLIDLTVGSALRSILESTANVALWLQYQAVLVLSATRLATSVASDVDTFGADFGFVRLAAANASGQVTFSRYVASSSAVVPIGALVKTGDPVNPQSFVVVTDDTNPAYSFASGGYLLPVNQISVNVPVVAVTGGTVGNVSAGSINLLASNISNVNLVTNSLPFTNGIDPESDTSFKARFVNFINSRSLATPLAIGYAIQSLGGNLTFSIEENTLPDGRFRPGYFTIAVDDGSGTPSSNLLNQVSAAVNTVRPIGSTFGVFAPTLVPANVSMVVTPLAGYLTSQLDAQIGPLISAYINSLPVGAPLAYTKLASLAWSVAGVGNITTLSVNDGTADIGGQTPLQAVRAQTVAVN